MTFAVLVAGCGVSVSTYPPGPTGSPSISAAPTAMPSLPSDSPQDSPLPVSTGPAGSTAVTAFFYPWYGTDAIDGKWVHWNQLKHVPPDDIASSFYPARGVYSSGDPRTLTEQMNELCAAHIGAISVSWWGQGSIEDRLMPQILTFASVAGVKVAFHLEPYSGQTAASMAADIHYLLAKYGSSPALLRVSHPTAGDSNTAPRAVFYVFGSSKFAPPDLKAAIATLRGTADDAIVMVHSPRAISATRVGADGVYTYDAMVDTTALAGLVADCKSAAIICSPSVAPGFDNRQAVATGLQVVDRRDGAGYDEMWQAVLGAKAEWVSITTFNEWHEGTQIEPAKTFATETRTYVDYSRAYGKTGTAAQTAYLERTAYWVGQMESR